MNQSVNDPSSLYMKALSLLVVAYNHNKLSVSSMGNSIKRNGKAVTIPDSMQIDCPIGPVPFPIGGGTIYAACPSTTTTDDDETNCNKENQLFNLRCVSVWLANFSALFFQTFHNPCDAMHFGQKQTSRLPVCLADRR
mmetsp:Transcript_1850/g.2003  ORF Transcript_1850/g.2003 Transcript_1850/m.2003 type:complete len:138 (+) Transcript_1850:245-658(+)